MCGEGLNPHLLLGDVQNALEGQFLEVEPVTLVKVGADGLWVMVHHHCTSPHLSEGADARHGTPVKLHTAAYKHGGVKMNHNSLTTQIFGAKS